MILPGGNHRRKGLKNCRLIPRVWAFIAVGIVGLLISLSGESFAASKNEAVTSSKGKLKGPASESMVKLTDADPMPSFSGVFLKLGGVVGLFLGAAFILSRLRRGAADEGTVGKIYRQINRQLGKVTQGAIGKDSLIQVISTHHLDPKRSIVMVRVAGRVLVLGLSVDSMNLITQFSDEGGNDFSTSGPDFSSLLVSESFKPKALSATSVLSKTLKETRPMGLGAESALGNGVQPWSSDSFAQYDGQSEALVPSLVPDVRSRIRSRLEGFKPL